MTFDPDCLLDQFSYFTVFEGIQVMFHLAIWFNAEQHRRLIGNDIVFIVFHEADSGPFDPTSLDQLGTVPQIYCVVQPLGARYRVCVVARPNIKIFGPPLPRSYSFDGPTLRSFLLTLCTSSSLCPLFSYS